MGYQLHPYAVDFELLRRTIGCGDDALATRLIEDHMDLLSRLGPPSADVVGRLIRQGAPIESRSDEPALLYGYALEVLCRAQAEMLKNDSFGSMHWHWFEELDSALRGLGSTETVSGLCMNGPPVDLPFIEEFPVIGHVEPSRVAALRGELAARVHKGGDALTDEVRAALGEVVGWLEEATRRERGLVLFYY